MTAKRLIRDETIRQAIRFAVNKLSKAVGAAPGNLRQARQGGEGKDEMNTADGLGSPVVEEESTPVY